MNPNKILTVDVNWLSEVDGMTVEQAIEYLKTIPKDHVLEYCMEGDTHGCNILSYLCIAVPKTNDEMLVEVDATYHRRISTYVTARENHVRNNNIDRIANCNMLIKQLEDWRDVAREKYIQ